jgi:hypothetical protein
LQERDAIDSYNESVWKKLGHPAFDDDFLIDTEETEWLDRANNDKP